VEQERTTPNSDPTFKVIPDPDTALDPTPNARLYKKIHIDVNIMGAASNF
jgi:hypothetical protein